jgi:hypothetical protein
MTDIATIKGKQYIAIPDLYKGDCSNCICYDIHNGFLCREPKIELHKHFGNCNDKMIKFIEYNPKDNE